MKNDKYIEKIKKCLALAKSGNANEAAAAMRQAQALMKKYNINQDQVDLSDVDYACIRAGSTKKPPKYHQMLVGLISDAFGVEAIYHVQNFFGIKTDIEFIGIIPQPEIAIYAYEVLHRQLTWDRNNYMKTLKRYKRANKTRKADLFAESWVQAVWINISTYEQSKEHKDLIIKFKNNRHNKLSKMKARDHKIKSNDDDALIKGAKAGSKANLHHGMNGEELKRLGEAGGA